ncbi:MAG: hypothetical protein NVSMB14_13830 [Isosphaeraceae bacterium]
MKTLTPANGRPVEAKKIDPELFKIVAAFVQDPLRWFHTPNIEFEGRKPIDLLDTGEEPRVRDIIEAAKYGLFS